MKPLNKINNEITKLETQLEQLQERLRQLKAQRTQLENAEMIAAIRNANFRAEDMLAVIQAIKNGDTDLTALLAQRSNANHNESEEREYV